MMSSMISKTILRFAASTVLMAPIVAATACHAQSVAPTVSTTVPALPRLSPPPFSGSISGAISDWDMLRRSDNMPFASYARFLISYPGWPGESVMRKNAENMLRADGEAASTVVAFFQKFPPMTATAGLRYAEALNAIGRHEEAASAARTAWRGGALTPDDETRFMGSFGKLLTPDDHDWRMDKLLWSRSTAAAARHIAYVSPARRELFAARLALLTKAPNAAQLAAAVSGTNRAHPGFIADYAWWMRSTGQTGAAQSLLSRPQQLIAPPSSPLTWLDMRLASAKSAADAGGWQMAYAIARQADDAYPVGTNVREQSFKERDVYTDLVWLAGTTALNKIGRPADAQFMFERYAAAAKSPQTQAKGLYYAGRAAEAASKRAEATVLYERAGQFFDQFHGQLALERLGRKPQVGPTTRKIEISSAERQSFNDRTVVRALVALGQQGKWQDQSEFIRTLSNAIQSDADHVLATELGDRIGRPDLKVLAGRSARNNGLSDYVVSAFPQITVPQDHASSWTMIHAISRQESQFDRQATSRVGARGLMQLMPGTARETAPRAGLSYSYESLTDPQYNVALGSTYFGQLMTQYGGSYVLAVAAYNAGPGNVNKWLRNNGDPRGGVDVLTWIDNIPLSETRNYVQRVLENAVVYDMLNPVRANVRTNTPLSTYLGKRYPG
jgi:soluble lytic murein transglycosylase